MTQEYLLSIVMPCYNVEKWLRRAVDSVLNQGLNAGEYELILIDDGSVDGTLNIMKEYAERQPEIIRYVHQENAGLPSARNVGMSLATSKYLYFMDSDDYLIDGGLRSVIDSFLEDDMDILSFYSTTLDGHAIAKRATNSVEGKIVYEGYGRDYYRRAWLSGVWTIFYSRQFIADNNIEFENRTLVEDILFNLRVMMCNPRIRRTSSDIYRYCVNDVQVTKRRDDAYVRSAIRGYMYLFNVVEEYRQKTKDKDTELYNNLLRLSQNGMLQFTSRILSSELNVSELRELRTKLRALEVLPMENNKYGRIVNLIYNNLALFPILKFGYKRVFVPYILPRISRN